MDGSVRIGCTVGMVPEYLVPGALHCLGRQIIGRLVLYLHQVWEWKRQLFRKRQIFSEALEGGDCFAVLFVCKQ